MRFTRNRDSNLKNKDKMANRPLFKRKKFCRFTVEGIKTIDYKDVDLLKDFISETAESFQLVSQAQNRSISVNSIQR